MSGSKRPPDFGRTGTSRPFWPTRCTRRERPSDPTRDQASRPLWDVTFWTERSGRAALSAAAPAASASSAVSATVAAARRLLAIELQHREERLLRDLDPPHLLHAL